jgi:hypothetical protein
MTANNRRAVRMLCKALLLISLPLAGFVWALPDDATNMAAAAALTLVSLVVGFGAEYLASSTENDIQELDARIAVDAQRRADDLAMRDEKLRQFDRIVNLLTEQNHDLRGKLVSVQVGLQRKRDAILSAAGEALAPEGIAQPTRSAFARAN